MTDSPVQTDYVVANGVRTYYEIHGEGEPVVLLHGGMCPIDTWSAQTEALAKQYRVYLPERRGHGRTADVDGPITLSLMADDTAAFMDSVGISNARVAGWSDGGNVGLILAMRRPDLVGRLIALGCGANFDGYRLDHADMNPTLDKMPQMVRDWYNDLSPDGPDHLPVVFDKIATMWTTEPTHDLSEFAAIQCPTLIMTAQVDVATIEHAAEMMRAIPNAQLAVVPGASHMVMFEKPELVNKLFLDFFAESTATA
jgi:pimeloyl-ACP methyl ester carboxylesterase